MEKPNYSHTVISEVLVSDTFLSRELINIDPCTLSPSKIFVITIGHVQNHIWLLIRSRTVHTRTVS